MAQRKLATTYPELFPLDDMYYTLELDFEDWEQEKNKKKQNKAKKESRRAAQEEEEKKKKKGSNAFRELRSLLPDVRPKKRGTSNYIYEGQEELYEALESVLTKIKDYQEHSYPFLTKVRKSDAPDYYKVIKKPMDLSVMTKKLERGEYSSKSEFQADLNLIYANCRIYNTDPSSRIYLEHAECLERKSKELMKGVKNIDFSKERKLLDASATTSPLDLSKERVVPEASNPSPSVPVPLVPSVPSVPLATPNQEEEEHTPTPKASLQSSNDSTTSTTPPIKSKQKSPDKEKEKLNASPMTPIKIEIPDLENENFQSKTDLYRCLTRQYRLQKLTHLHEQEKLPFGDRAALVRDANKMRKFMALSGYPGLTKKATDQSTTIQTTTTGQTTTAGQTTNSQTTTSSEQPNPSTPPPAHNPSTPTITSATTTTTEKGDKEKDKGEKGDKEKDKGEKGEKGEGEGGGEVETAEDVIVKDVGFFPELCFFVDSVPELHPCIFSDDEEEEEEREVQEGRGEGGEVDRMDIDESVTTNSVVIKKEKEEVQEEEIPRAKPNTPPTPPSSSNPTTPATQHEPAQPAATAAHAPASAQTPAQTPATVRTHYAPLHCVEYYNALLRRTIALVLSKSGFVTVGSNQVMDVLMDVVNGYMLRLGRILKTHMDDIGGQVPMEEIFSRVLCEMGVAGLAELREFVQNLYNPPDADMDDLEYDPRNSLYNRSSMGADYEFGDEDGYGDENGPNEFSEEELGSGTVQQESSTGRQKRQVTKISDRDSMYEYYEEEAQNADSLASGSAPVYAQPSVKPKKPLQKKNVKPPPQQKKRSKNPPPNVPVNKKKKQ